MSQWFRWNAEDLALYLLALIVAASVAMCSAGCVELTYTKWRQDCAIAYAYDEPGERQCVQEAKEAYWDGKRTFVVKDPKRVEVDGGQ